MATPDKHRPADSYASSFASSSANQPPRDAAAAPSPAPAPATVAPTTQEPQQQHSQEEEEADDQHSDSGGQGSHASRKDHPSAPGGTHTHTRPHTNATAAAAANTKLTGGRNLPPVRAKGATATHRLSRRRQQLKEQRRIESAAAAANKAHHTTQHGQDGGGAGPNPQQSSSADAAMPRVDLDVVARRLERHGEMSDRYGRGMQQHARRTRHKRKTAIAAANGTALEEQETSSAPSMSVLSSQPQGKTTPLPKVVRKAERLQRHQRKARMQEEKSRLALLISRQQRARDGGRPTRLGKDRMNADDPGRETPVGAQKERYMAGSTEARTIVLNRDVLRGQRRPFERVADTRADSVMDIRLPYVPDPSPIGESYVERKDNGGFVCMTAAEADLHVAAANEHSGDEGGDGMDGPSGEEAFNERSIVEGVRNVQQVISLVFLICGGILTGAALLQVFLVARRSDDVDFLGFYSFMANLVSTTVESTGYFAISLAIWRYLMEARTEPHWTTNVRNVGGSGKYFFMVSSYLLVFVCTLSMAPIDKDIHFRYDSAPAWYVNGVSSSFADDLSHYYSLVYARFVFAALAWGMVCLIYARNDRFAVDATFFQSMDEVGYQTVRTDGESAGHRSS